MQLWLLFIFLFTHPLESGVFQEDYISEINPIIVGKNTYISQINGIIENIVVENNKFTVKVSNDVIEIIISGLDRINVTIGQEINIGDKIGVDNKITLFTRFIMIQYNNAISFPQFFNNRLEFHNISPGIPIYSMESGVANIYYDLERGNIVEITKNTESNETLSIQYWHMSIIQARINDSINKNNRIGAVGSTGLSLEPNLTVFFANIYYDLRAIYLKVK